MNDDILCPWCKRSILEPKGAEFESAKKVYIGQMICPKCGAMGPICKADSPWEATYGSVTVALEAMRSYPICVGDLPDCDFVYLEDKGVAEVIPAIVDSWNPDLSGLKFRRKSGVLFPVILDDYGKRWRAWYAMPTVAERAAVLWEEDAHD